MNQLFVGIRKNNLSVINLNTFREHEALWCDNHTVRQHHVGDRAHICKTLLSKL